MLTEGLFEKVLIDPISEFNPDTLNIVSGYASPSMVERHFRELEKFDFSLKINLIIGMARSDGIAEARHQAFVNATNRFDFDCRYIAIGNPVHAKVYTWIREEKPVSAYSGSANYTITGFGDVQREILAACDSLSAQHFYELILQDTISCKDRDVETRIKLFEHRAKTEIPQLNSVELSLLDSKTGETHKRAGLNWGQRPGRDSDQAYIPIPSKVYNSNFFPPVGQRFSVLTDDGEALEFTRAQERGKALQTSIDNSLMGLYFRIRIGVGSGEFVSTEDLKRYGRTTVSIFKVDDKNYFLDFSVGKDTKYPQVLESM